MSQIPPAMQYAAAPHQGSFPQPGREFWAIRNDARSALSRSRLFSIGFEPRVDQRNDSVDDRMAQALLLGDQLHEFVGAFDVGSAVLQSTRGRGRTREALRRGSVFFERHQIAR